MSRATLLEASLARAGFHAGRVFSRQRGVAARRGAERPRLLPIVMSALAGAALALAFAPAPEPPATRPPVRATAAP